MGINLNPGCCCEEGDVTCDPCPIPAEDLSCALSFSGCVDQFVTLTYNPSTHKWESGLFITCSGAQVSITLECVSGVTKLLISAPVLAIDCFPADEPDGASAFNCDPFCLYWTLPPGDEFGDDCERLADLTTLKKVTIGGDECFTCYVCFHVVDCLDNPVVGAVLDIDGDTCTTDENGECCITPDPPLEDGDTVSWTGAYVDEDDVEHDFDGTVEVSCPGPNTVEVALEPDNTVTITVVNGCDDSPVEGADVYIDDVLVGTTDEDGKLILTDLGGTHHVSVYVLTDPRTDPYDADVDFPCFDSPEILITLPCRSTCTIFAQVLGCNGFALSGAAVSIDGSPAGTTGADGSIDIGGLGTGSHSVSISCDRFDTYGATINLGGSCPNVGGLDATLTPATGYQCLDCGGAIPIAETVYYSDTVYGSVTLTYTSLLDSWDGQDTKHFPGGSGCAASDFVLQVKLHKDCSVGLLWARRAGCPSDSPTSSGSITGSRTAETYPVACGDTSPPWVLDGTIPTTAPPYPSGASYTITE
jgi:hypothetical protein